MEGAGMSGCGLRLRWWHLRHAGWVTVLLPWGVAGPKRPIVPEMALSRLIFRAGIIHWHLVQALAPGAPEPPVPGGAS
jgi:hypothetical protein